MEHFNKVSALLLWHVEISDFMCSLSYWAPPWTYSKHFKYSRVPIRRGVSNKPSGAPLCLQKHDPIIRHSCLSLCTDPIKQHVSPFGNVIIGSNKKECAELNKRTLSLIGTQEYTFSNLKLTTRASQIFGDFPATVFWVQFYHTIATAPHLGHLEVI